jgi:methionine-rich copper-binding protein CopC
LKPYLLLPLVLVFIAVSGIQAARPASAHARPVRFDPPAGAVLNTAPASVQGWFTGELRRVDETFIRVLDGSGNRVDSGPVQLTSDRRQMSVALRDGLPEGRYLVYWSAFDDRDAHAVSGCHAFFMGQAAADAALAAFQPLDGGADCPATAGSAGSQASETAASLELDVPGRVSGDSVTVVMKPVNFTARAPQANVKDPNFGHYHIYLDKVPVEVLTGTHSHEEGSSSGGHSHGQAPMTSSPGGLVENPVMWVDNSYTFRNLEPGFHTVTVVLNYDNHEPLDPPVMATATFRIEGGEGGSGLPAWTVVLGLVAGLVIGAASMRFAGGRV